MTKVLIEINDDINHYLLNDAFGKEDFEFEIELPVVSNDPEELVRATIKKIEEAAALAYDNCWHAEMEEDIQWWLLLLKIFSAFNCQDLEPPMVTLERPGQSRPRPSYLRIVK